jgi:hypothetical protein
MCLTQRVIPYMLCAVKSGGKMNTLGHWILGVMSITGASIGWIDSAQGKEWRGSLVSMDSVVLRSVDRSLREHSPWHGSIHVWESQDVLEIRVPGGTGLSGGSVLLGALERPLLLQIKTDDQVCRLTIPIHRTQVYSTPQRIQIDVKNSQEGKIGVDCGDSTLERDAILASYATQRQQVNQGLQTLELAVRSRDAFTSRQAYAQVVDQELRSDDFLFLDRVLSNLPEGDRPIHAANYDLRFEIRELNQIFAGMNFDTLTRAEFISFLDRWTQEVSSEERKGDELYLLRVAGAIGLPREEERKFVIQLVDSRLSHLIRLVEAGIDSGNIPFSVDYQAAQGLRALSYDDSDEAGRARLGFRKKMEQVSTEGQKILKQSTMVWGMFFQ